MKILLGLVTTFALSVMIVAVGFSGTMGGLLWLLPGVEGGGAESDRGFEVRVIQARGASTVTPLAATVTRRRGT